MKRLAFSFALTIFLLPPAFAIEFNLGKIYKDNGISAMEHKDFSAAVNWFTMAHNVVGDSDKKLDGKINELMGKCYMRLNDLENAERAFKTAYGHYEQEYGAFNANSARILDSFAELSIRRNDFWMANSFLRKAFDFSMGTDSNSINDLDSIPYRITRLIYWASKTGNDIELEYERGLAALSAKRAKVPAATQSKIDATINTVLTSWKALAQKNGFSLNRYEKAAVEYSHTTASKPSPSSSLSSVDLSTPTNFHLPSFPKVPSSPPSSSFLVAPSKGSSAIYRPSNPFATTKEFLKSHETSYSQLQSELFRSDD